MNFVKNSLVRGRTKSRVKAYRRIENSLLPALDLFWPISSFCYLKILARGLLQELYLVQDLRVIAIEV